MKEIIRKLERSLAKARVALANEEMLGKNPYDAETAALTDRIMELARDTDAHIHQLLCLQETRKSEITRHV